MSDCAGLPALELDALAERLLASSPDRRFPLAGGIDLTARCNFACTHCYMRAYRDEPELATGEWLRIFGELADAGCLTLLFTGGEPLLRPDFLTLWRAARERGLVATLFTNGALLTEATVAALAERPPLWIEISLYGASEATARRVTGREGAFAASLAGLRLCRKAGLAVRAKSLLLRETKPEMDAIARLAADEGVEFLYNGEVFGRIGGDPAPACAALPEEEAVAHEWTDPTHRRIWRGLASGGRRPPEGRLFRCRAGQLGFHIGPYGDLNPCILYRAPLWSLRTGTFLQGWREALPRLTGAADAGEACRACPHLGLCLPCPAKNVLEHGDPRRPVERLCRRAGAIARAIAAEPAEVSA